MDVCFLHIFFCQLKINIIHHTIKIEFLNIDTISLYKIEHFNMPPFIKNDIIYSELVDNDYDYDYDYDYNQQQDVQQNNIIDNIQYDVFSPIMNLNDFKLWILLGCNLEQANIVSTLDLSYSSFEYVPFEIMLFTNLKVLNISNSKITSIPTYIVHLQNLETFDCSYNQITHIPPFIHNLIKLKYFNCSWNYISEYPNELSLMNLKYFDCSFNKFNITFNYYFEPIFNFIDNNYITILLLIILIIQNYEGILDNIKYLTSIEKSIHEEYFLRLWSF